ncbi:Hypothetical predicted protein [Paramuricea clavata]|uniref:QRICH1-like domain-containing protein n=1 Tax=Paramuricea clavata TaxID=317549 RepID=A0A6S7JUQ8_PARCT|nr:Hypothetical predicted protein [Paramuricea clavata]
MHAWCTHATILITSCCGPRLKKLFYVIFCCINLPFATKSCLPSELFDSQKLKKKLIWKIPFLLRTQYNTKWACKIFREWQYARANKDAKLEATEFLVNVEQVQSLETSMETMTCWSLNVWLTKFVEEVCKASGERYPPQTLYSICAGLQRHLEDVNGGDAIQLLSKNEMRLHMFRRALDSGMKQASADGLTNMTKKPDKEGDNRRRGKYFLG